MQNQWVRIAAFVLISGGLVWFLSSQVTPKKKTTGQVKSSSDITLLEEEENSGPIKVLGDKIEEIIPEPIKKQVEIIEEKIFKKSTEVVEENEIIQDVKETINQATEELNNFPEKQKEDIKKEVIKQVCDDLLKEVEGE